MQMKPTVVTYLDTRYKKKSGAYPVKLRSRKNQAGFNNGMV